MTSNEFLSLEKKMLQVYEAFCTPVCKELDIPQTSFDLLLFLANNPKFNTARDVCEIRGIKKGIVSVTVDHLVQTGYLIRKNDSADRRIQRLFLTEKCDYIISRGRKAQEDFFKSLTAPFTDEELTLYRNLTEKLRTSMIQIEKEL